MSTNNKLPLGYSLEGAQLTVSAPDEAASGRLIARFGEDFDRLWKRRAGEDARIVVGLRADAAGEGRDR